MEEEITRRPSARGADVDGLGVRLEVDLGFVGAVDANVTVADHDLEGARLGRVGKLQRGNSPLRGGARRRRAAA